MIGLGDEAEAARLVAFQMREPMPPSWVMTCNATQGSARVWRLTSPAGKIHSTTMHHWAAAGAQLACWIGKMDLEAQVAAYHWRVLRQLYHPSYLRVSDNILGSGTRIQRRVADDSWVDTPFSISQALMPTGLIDPAVTYLRDQFGLRPKQPDTFLAELRNGQDLVERAVRPLRPEQPLVIERPDYDELEAALAEAERLTS